MKKIILGNLGMFIFFSCFYVVLAEQSVLSAKFEHKDYVMSVAFSPDGSVLATGSNDGVRIYNVKRNKVESEIKHYDVDVVAFSPDNNLLAFGADNTVYIYKREVKKIWKKFKHKGYVTAVAFSPDSRLLVTGSGDQMARIYNISNGREIQRFKHGHVVDTVAFSPDGNFLVTGSRDDAATIYNIENSQKVNRFKNEGMVQAVAFSPNGKLLSIGSGETLRIYNFQTFQEVQRLKHEHGIDAVDFSPDGNYLAVGFSYDKIVKVYGVSDLQLVQKFEHLGGVWSVAFSPDGNLLATGSEDHTARIFRFKLAQSMKSAQEAEAKKDFLAKGHTEEQYELKIVLQKNINEENINGIKKILRKTEHVNMKLDNGITPLMVATMIKDADIVKLLIKKGAYVNDSNDEGVTPLHLASYFRSPECIEQLLNNGGNVNARANLGFTPIMVALKVGSLYRLDIEFYEESDFNRTVKTEAIEFIKTITLLVNNGANIFTTNDEGDNAVKIYSDRNCGGGCVYKMKQQICFEQFPNADTDWIKKKMSENKYPLSTYRKEYLLNIKKGYKLLNEKGYEKSEWIDCPAMNPELHYSLSADENNYAMFLLDNYENDSNAISEAIRQLNNASKNIRKAVDIDPHDVRYREGLNKINENISKNSSTLISTKSGVENYLSDWKENCSDGNIFLSHGGKGIQCFVKGIAPLLAVLGGVALISKLPSDVSKSGETTCVKQGKKVLEGKEMWDGKSCYVCTDKGWRLKLIAANFKGYCYD